MQEGEKGKKGEGGVFDRQKGCQKIRFDECFDICFLNIYQKHPLIGKNGTQSLKKRILQISQLIFWMLQGGQISDLSVHFHFL